MIKKILITLLVLIILIVVGLVSLVLFVDPNNFRGFISETVKDKTGYELTIEGDLRWHVWPQISILSGAVRLEDEGAKKPILTADNMRLDVELFPLFSKELSVKNVLVKSAVINITDESKGKVAAGNQSQATINNQQQTPETQTSDKGSSWTFVLNKLEIADSTVAWQQSPDDIINFRDINISVYQKDKNNLEVDLRGAINRDQRDLVLTLNADVNLEKYPASASIGLNKFTYDFKGIGLPEQGLVGTASAKLNYVQSPLSFDAKDLVVTLNDNKLSGELQANLGGKTPYFEAILASDKIDLTPFMTSSTEEEQSTTNGTPSAPVVASTPAKGNELAFLKAFDAKFNLKVKEIVANKLIASNFEVDANNKAGVATLHKVNLDIAKGNISASGSANGQQATTAIRLDTKAADIDLGTLFTQLDISNHFSGSLNAQGTINTNTIDSSRLLSALNGDMKLVVNNARLENVNIQQIIQSAVAQYTKDVVSADVQQKYTEVHELSADGKLANGQLNLTSILANSETLDIKGQGYVGLVKQDMDVNLNVKLLGGWNGKSETIQKLQQIVIPLRIYGAFTGLHYQLDIEKIIRDQFSDKIQQGLDKLKDRLQNSIKGSEGSSGTESGTEEAPTEKTSAPLNRLLNRINHNE
ncbi:outer membrane assembly protein AsmA [Zophobihabitans entericus]|uniref:Outer membrane assembly protein AsmA n=1 Tax=Zophobihabitans entericus TaxID=1635327 RepID=A0A6G9IDJ9_9GAMM|nr:outer membrane assembly protein AsmA [Zophobihabitans entericus]QIQ22306.1 outer membrane assembly protein AsmA [Zophobihabitans entericus]